MQITNPYGQYGSRLTEEQMLDAFRMLELMLSEQHIVYKSKKHGPDYVDKDGIGLDVALLWTLGLMLAAQFEDREVDFVVSPAVGAISIGTLVALALTLATGRKVGIIYTEKARRKNKETGEEEGPEVQLIKREILRKAIAGKKVFVAEDIINTGASFVEVAEAVREAGGVIVAGGCVWNRGNVAASQLGLLHEQFVSLITIQLPAYPAETCPLCAAGVPITPKPGHGEDWIKEHGQPPYV